MKTLLNSFKDGSTFLLEVPTPHITAGNILIKTHVSLLSSGTERMLVEFGKANLIQKAIKQPERVKEVLQKASTDGILSTYEAVNNKLNDAIPMGYSNVGTIVGIGKDVKGFNLGERVVSNGPHAEFVSVPKNLCAKVPDIVNDETAVFTVLGAIGLNGIRLANPLLGETFLVSGLGIIGLLTAQLLKANGCKVLCIDPDNSKCMIANQLGFETLTLNRASNPLDWCLSKTANIGLDGVIITATTTSNEPIELAANALRKRGRIILVGQTGLNLDRNQFYKKEISFQVSCSYGPGRYDKEYEEQGNDYPIGFVRWTEKRNFDAILQAMKDRHIKTNQLISKYFIFNEAVSAYEYLLERPSSLGLVLKYPRNSEEKPQRNIVLNNKKISKIDLKNDNISNEISFIGSGSYASKILIPAFSKAGAKFKTLASNNGINPVILGKRFKFKNGSTDIHQTINDKEIGSIIIATRHDSHSELILKALKANKNIFVEKPLCLNSNQLQEIEKSLNNNKILMVGFNRRFSPFIKTLKNKLDTIIQPKAFIYTCNAGQIDADHWIQNPNIGGGRLIGEACHFIDLLRFLSGSKIINLDLFKTDEIKKCTDTFTLNIKFENGSIGTIHYFSNGSKLLPKERLEVFTANTIFRIDNFIRIQSWGPHAIKNKRLLRQNKGQYECANAFLDSITSKKQSPIPIEEIIEIHKWIFKLMK